MRYTSLSVVCVLTSLLLVAGAGEAQAKRKHQSETVLVALEKGGIRSDLAEMIRATMDSRGVPVTINDFGSLDPDKANLYHAIVIIVDVRGGKPPRAVTNFLRRVPERDKAAITLAAFEKKGEWVQSYHGVEAMTSLPQVDLIRALANRVVGKLDLSIEKERAAEESEDKAKPQQQEQPQEEQDQGDGTTQQ